MINYWHTIEWELFGHELYKETYFSLYILQALANVGVPELETVFDECQEADDDPLNNSVTLEEEAAAVSPWKD